MADPRGSRRGGQDRSPARSRGFVMLQRQRSLFGTRSVSRRAASRFITSARAGGGSLRRSRRGPFPRHRGNPSTVASTTRAELLWHRAHLRERFLYDASSRARSRDAQELKLASADPARPSGRWPSRLAVPQARSAGEEARSKGGGPLRRQDDHGGGKGPLLRSPASSPTRTTRCTG